MLRNPSKHEEKKLNFISHRVKHPKSNPEIFRDLKEELQSDYEFVVCLDSRL